MADRDIRLYVECALAQGAAVTLNPGQVHYLTRVMRLSAGDGVLVFNGRDGEWRAQVTAVGKKSAGLRAETQTRKQTTEDGPWLLFAPVKKTGTDFIIEKATELGASRLVPVATARTQTPRINLDRFTATVVEAAEQCGRLTVPMVTDLAPLAHVAAGWPQDRTLLVLDETGHGRPLAELAGDLPADAPPPAFLTGPEGGFETGELDRIAALPFVRRVTLGPRILRAETACLAALSLWQGIAGDWR